MLGGGQDASQVTTTASKAGGFEARFFHKVREHGRIAVARQVFDLPSVGATRCGSPGVGSVEIGGFKNGGHVICSREERCWQAERWVQEDMIS